MIIPITGTDPYLVVGMGRCGTSMVSRILHEKLNVYMGEFTLCAEDPPSEYYEDIHFVTINRLFYKSKVSYGDWLEQVMRLIREREGMGCPWGIKGMRISDLIGLYLGFFNDPKIIWCTRDFNDTVDSWLRAFPTDCPNRGIAERLCYKRYTILERTLRQRDCLIIDFTERRDECEIERLIKEKWNI